MDIEIVLGEGFYSSGGADAEADAEGGGGGAVWSRAVALKGADNMWGVHCPTVSSLSCDLTTNEVEEKLLSGDYVEVIERSEPRGGLLISTASGRKRAERRSPEEMREGWELLVASGVARPMQPSDVPDVYDEESQKDLWCVVCAIVIKGPGSSLFNTLNFDSHAAKSPHCKNLIRFNLWHSILNEKPSLAALVRDEACEDGLSIKSLIWDITLEFIVPTI